jgi:hypothetical protein
MKMPLPPGAIFRETCAHWHGTEQSSGCRKIAHARLPVSIFRAWGWICRIGKDDLPGGSPARSVCRRCCTMESKPFTLLPFSTKGEGMDTDRLERMFALGILMNLGTTVALTHHPLNNCLAESRAGDLSGGWHQPCQIVGDNAGLNAGSYAMDDQIGSLIPSHVFQHHHPGKQQ